jgi:hypothetical protein
MQAGELSETWVWVGRVLGAVPVLLLVFFGVFGLLKPDVAAQGFIKLGYPSNAPTPIMIVEIAVALLYAIRRTAVLGAILITAYLGGAVSTHVRVGEPFYLPVLVAVAVWASLYLRDGRVRKLLPLRYPGN